MDPPVKAGPLLLLQPPGMRLGAKPRWKRSWSVLFGASARGVARLECFDCKDGAPAAAGRVAVAAQQQRPGKKIIVRLANCVSVAPAPDCCCGAARDGLAAFRLETPERAYLFAAEPPEAADWVARLCEAAFLPSPSRGGQPSGQEERVLEMATNAIYFSGEEAREFYVRVQKTEASERCRLQGVYVLKASWDSLVLSEPPSSPPLYTWPYRLLRRYGRDKVMFSFEAGRRCESGPGNFTFETKQGNEIFRVVEAAIRAQKARAEEDRRSGASLEAAEKEGVPGLAQVQGSLASVLALAGEGPPLERGAPGTAPGPRLSPAPTGKEQAGAPPKGPALRDPSALRLGRAPSPPPQPLGKPGPALPPGQEEEEEGANVYSEPLDAVKGRPPGPDPLYADPADSRPEGSGAREGPRGPASWLLYERVGPGASVCPCPQGHIYDEPEARAPLPPPVTAAIYDEACFPREAWRTQGLPAPAGCEPPCPPGASVAPAFPPAAGKRPVKPSPAPKPPRAPLRQAPQPGGPGKSRGPPRPDGEQPQPGPGSNCNNNSNNRPPPPEPLYSRVRKRAPPPPADPAHHTGPEQSVDESEPTALYEDLGEI